MSTLL